MSEESTAKKQLPLKPGLFVMPDDPNQKPYITAGRCKNCGTYFYPQRRVCLNCSAQEMETAPLSGKGKVYTYTIAHQQLPGALVQVPYAIAIVETEEGCQLHTVITEDWENVKVDMPVEVYFEKVFEDDDGNNLLAYKFRAVS